MSLDDLKTVEVLVGLIGTAFAALTGFLFWIDRRSRRFAEDVHRQLNGERSVDAMERTDIDGRLKNVERTVGEVEERVEHVERALETVARQADVAELRAEVGAMSAGLTAQMTAVTGMVDTLYKAAIRAGEQK